MSASISCFIELLKKASSQINTSHRQPNQRAPDSPECWGWRKMRGRAWVPQGTQVGWVVGNDLFLEPNASYEVAQQTAGTERLPVSAQTLRHRLREHGVLASVDPGRQMLLVRRTLEGTARQVLHLKVHD